MPAVGSTSLINVCPGRIIIHTFGMRALSAALTKLTFDDIDKVYAGAIRAAAQPIASTAAMKAPHGSGAFGGSIHITGGRSGAYLVSTDPGAGVIDFASSADTPDQWPQYGAGDVLTAKWGAPSRAFFPAIEEHLEEVAEATEKAVTAAYNALCARDWSGYPDG